MTNEWHEAWEEGKRAAAKRAIPYKVGETMWISADIPMYATASMIETYLNRRYPVKIVRHNPRRLWREESYTIEYPSGMQRKVGRWRLSKER